MFVMKWTITCIFLFSSLFADDPYYKILEQFSETLGRGGSWQQGEIQIAKTDPEIRRIRAAIKLQLLRKGFSKKEAEEYTKIGVITEDQYWVWIRDAVTFPGGIPGTYNRIVWKTGLSGSPGVVILPVLENKKILLNVNFRHATRAWELELPRGGRLEGETIHNAAMRELKEETGCVSHDLTKLGELAPETGMIVGTVPVYYAKVCEMKRRSQDDSEAIAFNPEMTIEEIKEAFAKGFIILDVKGVKTKVYCRDPFLTYALLQAMWSKLI